MLAQGHDVPGFAEFWEAGEYRLPEGPAHFTLFESFRADPAGSPLRPPSGRIEITSSDHRRLRLPGLPRAPRSGWSPTSGWAARRRGASRCT